MIMADARFLAGIRINNREERIVDKLLYFWESHNVITDYETGEIIYDIFEIVMPVDLEMFKQTKGLAARHLGKKFLVLHCKLKDTIVELRYLKSDYKKYSRPRFPTFNGLNYI